MGRRRKYPTTDGNVVSESAINGEHSTAKPSEAALARIGLNKQVCMSCNATAPENADACRKCGSSQLRDKSAQYRDA